MPNADQVQALLKGIQDGIVLVKCQRCGCMHDTLDHLAPTLSTFDPALAVQLNSWRQEMQSVQYECLGCSYCYPAQAQNAFADAFSEAEVAPLTCAFKVTPSDWPPVAGEYFVLDRTAPVAVSTLGSAELAQDLANRKPFGLAIVGKTETENIGIDKIVKNLVSNPAIEFLVVAGKDASGHRSGETLLMLAANGVDANGHVIGSPGKRPVLRNVSADEIRVFRERVQVINMLGCDDHAEIAGRVAELAIDARMACG